MSSAIALRRVLIIGSTLLASTALCSCASLSQISRGHLDIEPTELQSHIAPRFPARHCKTVLLCVELSNPLVSLHESDDQIGLAVDVRIIVGTRERVAHVGLAGRPRYESGQGQLFLDDLEITQLDMPDLPEKYLEWVRTAVTLVARQALQNRPVYRLDVSTAQGALAKQTISDVRVVAGKLRVTFARTDP